ncbi:alcohol dehydrogenase [Paenibacillus albidus]|uniref:Alcohol dehydrogenase n=1 Tax=Paenibacillus albidus TaxID=2041023 RepID=A0A917CXL1_9BACL|nr:alcohol dehydrogenase catalytic domain-containing protein [Paenibacillus albidus]GGF99033.1 alcohol dehydrogenase [Paenibacillus albidus]
MKSEHAECAESRKMPALVWNSQRLNLSELDTPVITLETDVKVKIQMTGICGTDLAVITGKEPGVPGVIRGHEAVGTVIETGRNVIGLKAGDRVVIDPNHNCGKCRFCLQGKQHLCTGTDGQGMPIAGLNKNGTFAPWFVAEEKYLHKLPEQMSWEAALATEPLACVLHNFRESRVREGNSVLILGSGPMGLLCQIVAKRMGCTTVSIEINTGRLAKAKQFSDYACPPEELTAERVSRILGDKKFDIVIDAVGTQMEIAERWVERGGTIIPFGINGKYQYTISPTFYTQNAVRLLGAGEYLNTFEDALQFAKDVPEVSALITHKYSLNQFETAIQELLENRTNSKVSLEYPVLKSAFVF